MPLVLLSSPGSFETGWKRKGAEKSEVWDLGEVRLGLGRLGLDSGTRLGSVGDRAWEGRGGADILTGLSWGGTVHPWQISLQLCFCLLLEQRHRVFTSPVQKTFWVQQGKWLPPSLMTSV